MQSEAFAVHKAALGSYQVRLERHMLVVLDDWCLVLRISFEQRDSPSGIASAYDIGVATRLPEHKQVYATYVNRDVCSQLIAYTTHGVVTSM